MICTVPITARPLMEVRSGEAEGPVYDPLADELLWVDIPAGLVNVARLGPVLREVRSYGVGDVVGAVVPRRDPADGWVVASRYGFTALDRSGVVTPIAEPERGAVTRMNDGKCDPYGGFWAGSVALDGAEGSANLYRLAPDGPCHRALTGVPISNGLAWRHRAHMYYVDTPTRRVDLLTVTPDGAVTDRRPAFDVPAEMGFPDGMTIDADGRLWVALWGGGAVAGFAPDGTVVATVEGGRGPGELLHVRGARPRDARDHDLAGVLHTRAIGRRAVVGPPLRGRRRRARPAAVPLRVTLRCAAACRTASPRCRCPRCRGSGSARRRSGSRPSRR
jgi:sugar lactone lactonase YvrE